MGEAEKSSRNGHVSSDHPYVSICIPSYNKAKYIGETIDSVLAQTYPYYEILVIDNASTDDTEKIINTQYRDRVVFYKNPTNMGYAYNFNRCISLAKYDYLLILPADDTILPTFLEKTVPMLKQYPQAGFCRNWHK